MRNFFRHWFGPPIEALEAVNFGTLKTDMHSHVLPGIDDGAPDLETAVALCLALAELGYSKLIATPHVMSDHYRNTPETISRAAELLRRALTEHPQAPQIEFAAEYFLDLEFMEMVKRKELLAFGDGYVLFEMGFLTESPLLTKAVFEMQMAGYKPVLAHPERYTYWHSSRDKFHEMADRGALLQLNINSLTGHYSPQTAKVSEWLLNESLVTVLGTDCHHHHHVGLMQVAAKNPVLADKMNGVRWLNASL